MTDACPSNPSPHDLLRLDAAIAMRSDTPPPGWLEPALAATPWVVVRRAPPREGWVPVGLRGAARNQRWAAWADKRSVTTHLSPEALASRSADLASGRACLPAFVALERLAPLLADADCRWGPTGSVGFELAASVPTVTNASDLDVLIRCDQPLLRAYAVSLVQASGGLGVRCDLLLETPAGGVSLLEYARADGPVVARGVHGPRLVDDPWSPLLIDPPRL